MENTTQGGAPNTTQEVKQNVKVAMHGLEGWLAPIFQNFPHIPEGGKKVITQIAPWLAIIFGILGIVGLFSAGMFASFATTLSGGLAMPYMLGGLVSMVFSGIAAVLMIMSYKGLLAMKKSGWNFAFYAQVVSIAGGLVGVVFGGGISGLLGTAIGAIIGLWILFEVRSRYTV